MREAPKYQGRRIAVEGPGLPAVEVLRPNGEVLDPRPSQKVWNHSPTGFEWGYGGSGPAQLALALLLDYLGDETLPMDEDLRDAIGQQAAAFEGEAGVHRLAVRHHQDFKRRYVAAWGDTWELAAAEIGEFLQVNSCARGAFE